MTQRVEIRFARLSDEQEIVAFLRDHWSPSHIFVTHPEVMRWQHTMPDAVSDDLNFVIARRAGAADRGGILALLGFIPFRKFDPQAHWSEVALAIWKVREDAGMPGLGLQLLKTLGRAYQPAMICAIGTSQVVRPIYTALGYTVGALTHAALFRESWAAGETIAVGVPDVARRHIAADPSVVLSSIRGEALPPGLSSSDVDELAAGRIPRKSWTYVVNRYLRHPYYKYEVRAAYLDGVLCAVFVWRKVSAPSGYALRIVDILGDPNVLARCGALLRCELAESGSEYLDVMCWGVDDLALSNGGFVCPDDHEQLIIPNYFEPFERKNVRIEIAFRIDRALGNLKVQLFRADSDQDRPNRLDALAGTGEAA